MPALSAISNPHSIGLDQLKRRWGWYLVLGLLMVILGMLAITCATTTILISQFTVIFIGWLMIAGGAMEIVSSFSVKAWGGFLIELLIGILYAVVGFMIVANPAATLLALTLLIAMFLMIGGVFRIVVAVVNRYPHWIWLLLSGAVNLLLGVLIWKQWPYDGMWVIGLFIGIDMVFHGWSLIMLSMAAKNMPASAAA